MQRWPVSPGLCGLPHPQAVSKGHLTLVPEGRRPERFGLGKRPLAVGLDTVGQLQLQRGRNLYSGRPVDGIDLSVLAYDADHQQLVFYPCVPRLGRRRVEQEASNG